ncbi:MAG TPA: hypothetical protein VF135_02080, partial [Terriglobales bacterium]
VCQARKEKRFCPSLHDRICAQCCGTERENTIDCTPDCTYLRQARQHDKPRSFLDLQGEELFREIQLDQRFFFDHEPLITGLMFAVSRVALANREWTDRDLIHAITEITRSAATRANSGLILQENTPNPVQQMLRAEIDKMVGQYRQLEEQNLGYARLKDSDVMRALVFLVRTAHSRTNGRRKSRAFVDTLRVQFPMQTESGATPAATGSNLIIP